MSIAERLKALGQRIPKSANILETEEATKNALVMPFIAALGYDVFDPQEVVPEFTCDVGTKKGEKVDYAIRRDGEIVMLVEAKKFGADLRLEHSNQLFRYFSVTSARIAILTNGRVYRFYTDLDAPNKMDSKPFLEIDLLDIRDNLLAELRKITKESFDLEHMLTAANDLKYMQECRRIVEQQFAETEEEFVRFFFAKANPSARFTQAAKEQFTLIVQRALGQFISDKVGERLRSALEREQDTAVVSAPTKESVGSDAAPESEDGIVTTEEELDGFRIVKAIVCSVLSPSRIAYRDAKSYFAILCDDNNRPPICRLHFNQAQKHVGLFDAEKNERRVPIETLDDIYKLAEELRATAKRYVGELEPA